MSGTASAVGVRRAVGAVLERLVGVWPRSVSARERHLSTLGAQWCRSVQRVLRDDDW